ncbi:MAG: hypothetical protein E6Q58_01560 [Niabella sp.]|nr:MAG: hypothetical protein E6Q58_01560 [Niabella sp.]
MKEKKIKLQNKELRRNLELIKAQLKSTGTTEISANELINQNTSNKKSYRISQQQANISTKNTPTKSELYEINTAFLKKDLLKTFILSALAFGAIFYLKFASLI